MIGRGGVGSGSKVVERRNAMRVVASVIGVVVVVGVGVVDVVVVAQSALVRLGIFDAVL